MSRSNRAPRSREPVDETPTAGCVDADRRSSRLSLLVRCLVALLITSAHLGWRRCRRRLIDTRDRHLPARHGAIRGPPDHRSDPLSSRDLPDAQLEPLGATADLPARTASGGTLAARREGDRLVIEDPTDTDASLSSTVWVDVER